MGVRRLGFGKIAAALAVIVATLMVVAGCGGPKEHIYSACGQFFSNRVVSGQAVDVLNYGKLYSEDDGSVSASIGYDAVLVLVAGCAHGADVTISGNSQAHITSAIHTSDGRDKAIEITFPAGVADPRLRETLLITQGDRVIGNIRLEVGTSTPRTIRTV